MFKSSVVTVTSITVPVEVFATDGNANQPVPIQIYNPSANTVLIGGSTKAACGYPLLTKESISFGIIGGNSLYARLTVAGTIALVVLIGG